jgi:nicotinamide-nucleotide amidase
MTGKTCLTLGWAILSGACLAAPAATPAERGQAPVDYAIVVTGSELLTGVYPDAHTYFLTRTLRHLNLHCVGSTCVDDRPADIQEALRHALTKVSLVIVTGGLGPTDDDVTRETLSDFTGIPLQEQEDALAAMERRFQQLRDKLRPNLRRQTRVPTRGSYLKSQSGTAVGLVFETDRSVIVALPGPPRELQPMVRDELVPYLHRRFGTRLAACSLRLRFVGVGQSQIDHTLKEHALLAPDMVVTTQFTEGRVDFEFSLPDDTPANCARLAALNECVREHLGEYLYADDETTLEQVVIKQLQTRGLKLVVAESGSGGGLAQALDGADGADEVLVGAYVAPNDDRLRRLLRVTDESWAGAETRNPRAELLASAAGDVTGASCAVTVGEVQAEGEGRRFVETVFRLPKRPLEHVRLGLRGTGELARASLTTQLLDALRRRLQPDARKP